MAVRRLGLTGPATSQLMRQAIPKARALWLEFTIHGWPRFAVVISAAIVHGSGPKSRPTGRRCEISAAACATTAEYAADSGKRSSSSNGECGIGAVVPWMEKLWMITYPPHQTKGGSDKLYEIDSRLAATIRPESVGGTHACRMIHRESSQLIIGPYFIDAKGNVRAADVTKLVGRMTAVMRHLTDPANKAYFFDMEGAIYEVNVHTLEVARLFAKPVPGWHGKGGYTSQSRVVIANNGERESIKPLDLKCLVGEAEEPGGGGRAGRVGRATWRIVEHKQFIGVTGPGGIYGAPTTRARCGASAGTGVR